MIWNPFFPSVALNPWRELAAVRSELARPQRFPAVRAHAGDDAVVIEALLPGVTRERLELSIEKDALVLAGEIPAGDSGSFRHERPTGRFQRRLQLPFAVDAAAAQAELADGLLRIRLPRSAQDGPVRIHVS